MLQSPGPRVCLLVAALLIPAFTASAARPGTGLPSGLRSGRLQVEGGSLYYEVAGSGEPLVFIHDGMLHREVYEGQFALFSEHFNVVRYDRRGFGRSPEAQAPYSDVEDLLRLLDEIGIRSASLIGMSAGGRLAVDFTLAHPDRVEALVLVGPVVSGLGYTDHFLSRGGRLKPSDWADASSLARFLVEEDPYEIAPGNAAAKETARRLLEANPTNLRGMMGSLSQPPSRPAVGALGEIRVPTLIMVGEHDIPDVHAHAGALEAGIPGARRILVPGAGHLVALERPDEFNAAALAFLRARDFFAALGRGDATAAVAAVRRRRASDPGHSPASEEDLNAMGYRLLQSGSPGQAVEIFTLNAEIHPGSWNAWDSLGEGQLAAGQTDAAIRSYGRSLELNPGNENARRALARIEESAPAAGAR